MRWLLALATLLGLASQAGASVGTNPAIARGHTYNNARAITPYQGGNSDPTSLPDDAFWVATSLANPVWRSATNAQVTLFAIPKDNGTYRVRLSTTSGGYGTTCTNANCITACYKNRTGLADAQDTDGTCNVTSNTRVDFILGGGTGAADNKGPNLAHGTRYYYVVERLEAGGSWSKQPEFNFITMSGIAGADQHFAYVSDEHSPTAYGSSACGTETGTTNQKEWDLFRKTQGNMLLNNSTHQYLFYLTTGDNAMTHSDDASYHPCTTIMGKSPHEGGLTLLWACADQNECDARWLLYLWSVQPVTKYIPLVWTAGNHEGETLYAQQTAVQDVFTDLTGSHGIWYFDATHSLEFYSRTARTKYFPNPDFTYDGTSGNGSANGNYYSLASASFELIVGDIEGGPAINLDGDANLREWPDDFPGSCPASSGLTNIACTGSFPARGWHDWTYGATQCTFLTGAILADCIGTTGRLGAFTGLAWETLTIKWKMLTSHHSAGSNSQYNDKTMYGRGGMGNVQQICDTSAEIENDGAQCTVDSDCHNVNGTIVGAVLNTDCGSGTNPDMTGTLAGNVQATLQAQAETFRIASGGNSFFLYGHDHLSTCAQKYKAGPTATGVYYCTGTQPGYEQSGPNWTDNPILVTSYDWGGKTNGSDQRADYCTLPSRTAFIEGEQNEAACNGLDSASPSSGSVLRGYIDMRVNGTTNVTMTQYSSILDSEPLLLAIEPNNTAEWTMTAP